MCFFLPTNHFARPNLRRTERKYRWTDSIPKQIESVHPTDSVVFRTCQLVVSSLFSQSQSFIFDLSTDFINRFYLGLNMDFVAIWIPVHLSSGLLP